MTMIESPRPAVAFPPGEYLADELAERGWTIAEFAAILGRPAQAVSEIINGHKEITPATAVEIAAATGTAPETWLRLQDTYRLWNLSQDPPSQSKSAEVTRRARLAALVPMPELRRRGVVPDGDVDAQEQAICRLLDIASIENPPRFALAARRSSQAALLTPPQLAWIGCARLAASNASVGRFDVQSLGRLGENLTRKVSSPSDLTDLPARFAGVGVRLVHVAKFKNSKIDGAAYRDNRGPVIAVSGRISRFDSVLFTLLHEIAHVVREHVADGYTIDEDLQHPGTSTREREADGLASRWAIPGDLVINAPISKVKVLACAEHLGVHPALVVGRLQHEGRLPWSHLNGVVPSARSYLALW